MTPDPEAFGPIRDRNGDLVPELTRRYRLNATVATGVYPRWGGATRRLSRAPITGEHPEPIGQGRRRFPGPADAPRPDASTEFKAIRAGATPSEDDGSGAVPRLE